MTFSSLELKFILDIVFVCPDPNASSSTNIRRPFECLTHQQDIPYNIACYQKTDYKQKKGSNGVIQFTDLYTLWLKSSCLGRNIEYLFEV